MFIITKTIHIKYNYENDLLCSLKQYYPSPGTNGCINIEVSHVHRTNDEAEYMIRMLWKTQQDYHTWLSQREESEAWKHKIQSFILSSKSNAAYVL
ncbi:TPA: hypothetical protein QCY19_001464 [Bacillus luti]|nr:hypothetical protein [Bacillus luti]